MGISGSARSTACCADGSQVHVGSGAHRECGWEPAVDHAHKVVIDLRQWSVEHNSVALNQGVHLHVGHHAHDAPWLLRSQDVWFRQSGSGPATTSWPLWRR